MTHSPSIPALRAMQSPSAKLLAITLAALLACLVITLFALRTPWLRLSLAPTEQGPGLEVVAAQGPAASIPVGSRLVSIAPASLKPVPGADSVQENPRPTPESLNLESLDLTEDPGLLGSFDEVQQLMQRQSSLTQMLRQGPVQLSWENPRGVTQQLVTEAAARRPLGSLPWIYWMQLACGLLAVMIGSWVWVLRPNDWGARMFALCGAMMLAFTLPAAWYSTRELALDGTIFTVLAGINISGAIAFGCALIAIFLCFPRQLVAPRYLWLLPLVFGIFIVGELLQAWPRPLGNLVTLVQTVIALGCVILQWRATRQFAAERAALRWVALSALVGAALFVVPMGTAWLLEVQPPMSQGMGFTFFLIMFAGMALGVARFRLFALDEWAYRILLWIVGVVLLVLVDTALLWALHTNPALSLGLALLVVGFLYLPLRNWLWDRLVGKHAIADDTVFRGVLDVVLEPDEQRRALQWQNFLRTLFRPLELRARLSDGADHVAISEEGQVLYVPAVSGSSGLELRHPWQGRGLFNREHLRITRRLLAFLAQADVSRIEFERGVREERQRIARDLHDDIASRLITSLHQTDDRNLQRTLRTTLQDLRIILNGLTGAAMTLGELLDRLESETRERLGAAHIEVDWRGHDAPVPEIVLNYSIYKNLVSAQREVISNILRHSGATRVNVDIEIASNTLPATLEITTNDQHPVPTPETTAYLERAVEVDRVEHQHGPLALEVGGRDADTDADLEGDVILAESVSNRKTSAAPPEANIPPPANTASEQSVAIKTGMGLDNLRQRLATLGGEAEISTHPQGQRVRLRLPLPSAFPAASGLAGERDNP